MSYDGTFTVPYVTYDAYGRVTGRTNRTMTMPSASSSFTNVWYQRASSGANSHTGSGFTVSYESKDGGNYPVTLTLPSGGSWASWTSSGFVGIFSGGSAITNKSLIKHAYAIKMP